MQQPRGRDGFFFLGQSLNMLPTLKRMGIDFFLGEACDNYVSQICFTVLYKLLEVLGRGSVNTCYLLRRDELLFDL